MYVFLNSFGLMPALFPNAQTTPSLLALSVCYTSGVDTLKLVTKDFATVKMLVRCRRGGQWPCLLTYVGYRSDSLTVSLII